MYVYYYLCIRGRFNRETTHTKKKNSHNTLLWSSLVGLLELLRTRGWPLSKCLSADFLPFFSFFPSHYYYLFFLTNPYRALFFFFFFILFKFTLLFDCSFLRNNPIPILEDFSCFFFIRRYVLKVFIYHFFLHRVEFNSFTSSLEHLPCIHY